MTPVRTCVGCRGRAPVAELVRLAMVVEPAGSARVVVDRRHRLPGRGAWIHAEPGCVAAAQRRQPWPRAFRRSGAVDGSAVQGVLEAAL